MQSVDVAIVGGGMVGLAVACGLQGSGLRVAVLEQAAPQPLSADAPPALRVSAINAASEKLLNKLGVWEDIVARRASCLDWVVAMGTERKGQYPSQVGGGI